MYSNTFTWRYLWIVEESVPVVDASSASTPLVQLRLPHSLQLLVSIFLRRFFLAPSSCLVPPVLLTLPEPSLLIMTSPLGPSWFSVVLPRGQRLVAMESGRWRYAEGGGRQGPLPKAAHLSPVRARPQQRPLHQTAHHHIGEVETEVLEVHPVGGGQSRTCGPQEDMQPLQ